MMKLSQLLTTRDTYAVGSYEWVILDRALGNSSATYASMKVSAAKKLASMILKGSR